ncbi:MAG: hypothetical protein ABR553_01050 [Gammaproteobacteria bacterium]
MTVSVSFLATMVTIALAITCTAPVILLLLWLRDWRAGRLW